MHEGKFDNKWHWHENTVTGYNDKQWCTDLHWVLYFVFCCPLCNGWLEELIHLFASCVVWRQNLLLLHILNVLARLKPFANQMCHFDHECHCFSVCVNCFEMWHFSWLLHQSNEEKLCDFFFRFLLLLFFFCTKTIITPKWIAFIIYTLGAFFEHMTNMSYYTDQSRSCDYTEAEMGRRMYPDCSGCISEYLQCRAILKYCSVYQLIVYCIVHFSTWYITTALPPVAFARAAHSCFCRAADWLTRTGNALQFT